MSAQAKSWVLLVAHVLLVSSIAGKYEWERHTCPSVWTRATQYDPSLPLRGRYLALTLHVDACRLPQGEATQDLGWNPRREWGATKAQQWQVAPLARDGKLAARVLPKEDPEGEHLTLQRGLPCAYASLTEPVEFFIAEHAQTPFPLPEGEELWAEVTVPPSGPPRPVRLAVSDGAHFRVLDLR